MSNQRLSELQGLIKSITGTMPTTSFFTGNSGPSLSSPSVSTTGSWGSWGSPSGLSGPSGPSGPSGLSGLSGPLSGFSSPSSNTMKYVAYVLVGIVLLILICLFLQSIGINIIQTRAGAPGFIPLPSSFDNKKTVYKREDISGLVIIDPTFFTVSTNFTIDSKRATDFTNPDLILYYGSDYLQPAAPNPSNKYLANVDLLLSKDFLFAIWLDRSTMDLIVQFLKGSTKILTHLSNPSFDIPITITLVFNKNYGEVYINGKLTKSTVFTNTFTSSNNAKLYNPLFTNISSTTTVNSVTMWNTALSSNEVHAIKVKN